MEKGGNARRALPASAFRGILQLQRACALSRSSPVAAWVYIVASGRNGTLYTGVTTDLPRRGYEHREGLIDGFTHQHGCQRLVWYAEFEDVVSAITHEKRLKRWRRDWKIAQIEEMNPAWEDLYERMNA